MTALAALVSARAGDWHRAEALLRELEQGFPRNTVIKVYWAPAIRAAIAIESGNAEHALQSLQATIPYESASPPPMGLASLYPIYLRGEAYLLRRQGEAAAREFRKIVDRPGLVLNFTLHAVSFPRLARARALAGDTAGARQAYQDFFRLWKDADSEIPIFTQAKGEYARLE